MKLPQAPDWLAYVAVASALAIVAVAPWRSVHRPRPPRSQILAPPSLFDQAVWVSAPPPGPGAGTAFSVAERGVWLTARHVVENCPRVAILTAPGHGVVARVRLTPGRETAILYTDGGAPALPIAAGQSLRRGERAFHPGYPRARPGEAASELRRRANLVVRGPWFRAEPVLIFSETGREPAIPGALEGLSGAPALDSAGRVLGVTVAEAPRRRRIYTTTPTSLDAALREAGVLSTSDAGETINRHDYARIADDLRARLSVAEVVCLPR